MREVRERRRRGRFGVALRLGRVPVEPPVRPDAALPGLQGDLSLLYVVLSFACIALISMTSTVVLFFM